MKSQAVNIVIPGPLRPHVQNLRQVEIHTCAGSTVQSTLERLVEKFPALTPHLFDEHQQLRKFINLFVNSEDIRYLEEQHTTVQGGDELQIVPSVSGG